MKRKKLMIALVLLPIFLVSEISISTAINLEEIEQTSNTINYYSYDTIVVDSNDYASYKSIQQAIDDAEIGSTVFVKKGEYSEIITVDKEINLVGEDKNLTFINSESNKNGYAIKIAASGVKISGFSISNYGLGLYTTGVKITAPETTIENCNIFDTPVGIAVWSSNNVVLNCTFYGCEDEGIAFLGSAYSDCNNNLVKNCEFYDNCDGIELQYSSENIIISCDFYDNTHAGIDAIGSSNNDNVISDCYLGNNDVFGIYLSRSSNNEISACKIENNQVMMNSVEDTTIIDSEIENLRLVNSKINVENCSNFDTTKVNTINSECFVENIESTSNVLEEDDNLKVFYFSAILNFIKLRLASIKEWILNNR